MSQTFFQQPILNSPYQRPQRHWQLDDSGQPTQSIIEKRRLADFITPIPRPRKVKGQQAELTYEDSRLSSSGQSYAHAALINELRQAVESWRKLPPGQWRVTKTTERLLTHWRTHPFADLRPFFCQIEAVETVIWLTEVAPTRGKDGQHFIDYLQSASEEFNPGLLRLALKLATGAGKTTVMAMLIAWQTLNAVRHRHSKKFTQGFLIVAPGITIRDRLRVLLPNDPASYCQSRELVPPDLLADMQQARIVITNYHAFKRRETQELAKGTRRLLQGRHGQELQTQESEGQMLNRVMPELLALKNILVINDEAHHCYREKSAEAAEKLSAEEKAEAQENNQAARLWISGLESLGRKLKAKTLQVIDLSATPFFLAGSGYSENTLFPWTLSDFSLMDAIECGIVKLPRVPVIDNVPGEVMPVFRNLWQHIGSKMPKKGRSKNAVLDPLALPLALQSALEALYRHYEETHDLWQQAGIRVPPCFIVVCNNTATSKLLYDFIAGFTRADGSYQAGKHALLRNFDDSGQPLARPNTLLIDSQQLESGEALDDNFRRAAADEIEQLRRNIIARGGSAQQAAGLSDQDLLREVMNSVGKAGQLGESIRCVVSVSMLTEGWDANTVTHILGVRAFGTQLLCEQVIGRALRRQSYQINNDGLLDVEYADIFGIPFDFTAKPEPAPPKPPKESVTVKAMRPERDHLEITFPRVLGYRVERAGSTLQAQFTDDHRLLLTPAQVGPTQTKNAGLIGEEVELNVQHLEQVRPASVLMHLTRHLMRQPYWRENGAALPLHRFGQLKHITRTWLDSCLECKGGTYPAQLLYLELAELACQRILKAITQHALEQGDGQIKAILDPYNPSGSTAHVRFSTSRDRYETVGPPPKNHINWAVTESTWEGEFCRIAEACPQVVAYTKNYNLGFSVPYQMGSVSRQYVPDFILKIDDGRGADDLLNLIVEVKGYKGEDAKEKKTTTETYWIHAVNNLQTFGRWAFVEFCDVWGMQTDFEALCAEFTKRLPVQSVLQ